MLFICWFNAFYLGVGPTGTSSNPCATRLFGTWHDFCLLFIEYRSFRDHELTSLIHAIFFLRKKLPGSFSFFIFLGKRKNPLRKELLLKNRLAGGQGVLPYIAGCKVRKGVPAGRLVLHFGL
jgi:hypothetical protein